MDEEAEDDNESDDSRDAESKGPEETDDESDDGRDAESKGPEEINDRREKVEETRCHEAERVPVLIEARDAEDNKHNDQREKVVPSAQWNETDMIKHVTNHDSDRREMVVTSSPRIEVTNEETRCDDASEDDDKHVFRCTTVVSKQNVIPSLLDNIPSELRRNESEREDVDEPIDTKEEGEITDNDEENENTEGRPPKLKYDYKEDQWSPLNPEGKKQYDREFLICLQRDPLSLHEQKEDAMGFGLFD